MFILRSIVEICLAVIQVHSSKFVVLYWAFLRNYRHYSIIHHTDNSRLSLFRPIRYLLKIKLGSTQLRLVSILYYVFLYTSQIMPLFVWNVIQLTYRISTRVVYITQNLFKLRTHTVVLVVTKVIRIVDPGQVSTRQEHTMSILHKIAALDCQSTSMATFCVQWINRYGICGLTHSIWTFTKLDQTCLWVFVCYTSRVK